MTSHTPKWKRLLKLKDPQPSVNRKETQHTNSQGSSLKKRPRSGVDTQTFPNKKRLGGGEHTLDPSSARENGTTRSWPKSVLKKIVNPNAAKEMENSSKKNKPQKKIKFTSAAEESEKAALQYLKIFNDDRAKWKFQKARQNWIFRHTFDPKRITPEYEAALILYIKSATDASKERLSKEAYIVIKNTKADEVEELERSDLEARLLRANRILHSLGKKQKSQTSSNSESSSCSGSSNGAEENSSVSEDNDSSSDDNLVANNSSNSDSTSTQSDELN
ncbi:hypothetical protein NEOLI_002716 [Neolecta irregularis DAH-3]|uniref:WKF domain-containing protein n=1 Tax=Neolecta irregularis (strain DAH-3) TaxID=1198029 RepID=A0A1U7LT56_NEOID|nr:hypothetical protein NEOLI_002716 [Neolecta irregularis DAH-3]|eukprot:OLL25855.1 hypothetical protein NEOLI_002716 [Neolecta irregularis DAH-3]